jgi:cell division protease FtsH
LTEEKNQKQPHANENAPKKRRFGLFYILLLILAVISLQAFLSSGQNLATYHEFLARVESGHVQWVELSGDEYVGEMEISDSEPPPESDSSESELATLREETEKRREAHPRQPKGLSYTQPKFRFTVKVKKNEDEEKRLIALLDEKGVQYSFRPESGFWPTMLIWMLPLVLIVGLWFMLMRQSGQLGRTAMSFGKTRAKLAQDGDDSVDFGDVAGCDEAKEELQEIVEFLRSPKKYQTLGGRMPKGILLVGPPGTGKTLLARAVAGEAGKPFFQLSGSDFVEMFVGVGAARVRDLFQQAKTKAPCIVFVDELDAVGRQRGAGLGGGHDEREQTLNQLLVEMDGFDTTSGVIFLAATNRPDVLDPALLRPGRFDRQVTIDAPDLKGREEILQVHIRGKPIEDDIDLHHIAANTPGFTGADLANVLNEAALLSARHEHSKIKQSSIDEAVERVMAGPERRSRKSNEEQLRRTAYHEAGHALVAELSEHADPVRKVTIVPRGRALGYTMMTPEEDQYSQSKEQLLDQLKMLMAGRAAELLVFNELWTGATSDLERASQLARAMVCRLGMSENLGPVVYGRENQQVFLGRDMTQEERNYSEKTAQAIDTEVRNLLESSHEEAMRLLSENRATLDVLSETLLEKESLSGKQLNELLDRELGDKRRRSSNAGSEKTGGDETGSDETGSDETGSDEAGSDEAGSDETGSDEAGSDETGSEETGSTAERSAAS